LSEHARYLVVDVQLGRDLLLDGGDLRGHPLVQLVGIDLRGLRFYRIQLGGVQVQVQGRPGRLVAGSPGWAVHALHRASCRRTGAGVGIEQPLGGLALHHHRRDLVGVALVRVARLADAALELDTAALLNDVGSLVRRGEQVGALAEHDVVAGRVGVRAHRVGGRARLGPDVGLHRRDVVPAERALDHAVVRQRRARCRDPARRGGVDMVGALGVAGPAALHGSGRLVLDQRALADGRPGVIWRCGLDRARQ